MYLGDTHSVFDIDWPEFITCAFEPGPIVRLRTQQAVHLDDACQYIVELHMMEADLPRVRVVALPYEPQR